MVMCFKTAPEVKGSSEIAESHVVRDASFILVIVNIQLCKTGIEP